MASDVLTNKESQFFIAAPPKLLLPRCKWVHPLAVLPKGSDKCRLIHDYSSSRSDSINSRIDYDARTSYNKVRTSYDKVDGAFRVMRRACWSAKIDIKAFFRHIPLDPADWELMGFRWNGKVFVDTRLNAPEISWRPPGYFRCIEAGVNEHLPVPAKPHQLPVSRI